MMKKNKSFSQKVNNDSKEKKSVTISNKLEVLEPLKKFEEEFIKKDLGYIVEKLHELISDPVTRENKQWICRLLHDFFEQLGAMSFKVKHLPAIMQILEFLVWQALDNDPEYNQHLIKMLKVCAKPPLLEKSSEILTCSEILDHYFSVLGYLAVLLSQKNDIKALKAINYLLLRHETVDIAAVKLEFFQESVERSNMPVILVELVEICSQEIYNNVIETVYVVASISDGCCHKMLAAGILSHIISRLVAPSQEALKNQQINEIIAATNILWLLMKSMLQPVELPESLKSLPAPTPDAMRSLRDLYKIVTPDKNAGGKIKMIRNDLTAIILAGLIALPTLPLVNYDLADHIIMITVMIESRGNEEIHFKKTLLMILGQFSKHERLIPIMIDHCVIKYVLHIIEDANKAAQSSQIIPYSDLTPYALQALTFLVPKMPEDFIKNRGSIILMETLKWNASIAVDSKETLEVMKTIVSIVASNLSILLTDFIMAETMQVILEIIQNTLNSDKLTLKQQKVIILLIMTIEEFTAFRMKLCEIFGMQIITLLIKYLGKYGVSSKERLVIVIGACLWRCLLNCSALVDKFITINGLHLVLNVTEKSNSIIQSVYLGLLIDLCSNSGCISHICGWKSVDKNRGLLSLMGEIWREEEKRIGVKRTLEGCIEDLELPIMGHEQWRESFTEKIHEDFSPAIASLFGYLRPKIYSIRKILTTHSLESDDLKEYYQNLQLNLPIEDSITFCIVDQFLRFMQGQVWAEVLRYMRETGIIPVGVDGEMLLVMRQRHRQCAVYVKTRQEKLLRNIKRQEAIKEHEEMNKIRDKIAAETLKKLEHIDYVRRTADVEYRRKKKKEEQNNTFII